MPVEQKYVPRPPDNADILSAHLLKKNDFSKKHSQVAAKKLDAKKKRNDKNQAKKGNGAKAAN
jgi:hypothetical protein